MEVKTPARLRPQQASGRKDSPDAGETTPLEVFLRLKPVGKGEEVSLGAVDDRFVRLDLPNRSEVRHYKFTRVFDTETNQKAVFDTVALPLIADALKGKSSLLFTYGVSGSGKTFTMSGTPDEIGILPRTADVVFNSVRDVLAMRGTIVYVGNNQFEVNSYSAAMLARQNDLYKVPKTPRHVRLIAPREGEEQCRVTDTTFLQIEQTDQIAIFASYVEIHESKVFDLLDNRMEDVIRGTFKSKQIRDLPSADHACVRDVREIEIRSAQEAMDVLNAGQTRRKVASTSLNAVSSRGHAIFTLKFVRTKAENVAGDWVLDKKGYAVSQLSLVDLAGSERLNRTGNQGQRRKEGSYINQSLLTLRSCFETLRENQQTGVYRPVPFRDSKLTLLFKGFFQGRGHIRVIICVNPRVADTEENVQVLRFAEDVQDVAIPKQSAARLDSLREALPCAGDIAPSGEVAMLVDLLPPLFPANATEGMPSVLPFNPDEMFKDPSSSTWDLLAEELMKRAQVRQTRALMAEESIGLAEAKAHKLVKAHGGVKALIEEKEAIIKEQDSDIKRMRHLLNATQCEREQLRVNSRKLEKVQAALENQLLSNEEEVKAERFSVKQHLRHMMLEGEQELYDRVLRFEKKKAEAQAEFKAQAKETQEKKAKISTPPLAAREMSFSFSESDVSVLGQNAPEEEMEERGRVITRSNWGWQRVPRAATTPRGISVVNPRYRRSLSQGNKEERWLDHQPELMVPLGTIMTPAGLDKVRRKSVTKLEKKDVAKCSRYSLTHQQYDSDGDLETHIYKGDLIPTAGGGFQCILSDKEILQQKSPIAGKKRMQPSDDDEDEQACRGHNLRSSKYS